MLVKGTVPTLGTRGLQTATIRYLSSYQVLSMPNVGWAGLLQVVIFRFQQC